MKEQEQYLAERTKAKPQSNERVVDFECLAHQFDSLLADFIAAQMKLLQAPIKGRQYHQTRIWGDIRVHFESFNDLFGAAGA